MAEVVVDESTTRSIALDENDWLWATWRARKKKQLPADLSPSMSKDEARLWFECLHSDSDVEPKAKIAALAKKKLSTLTVMFGAVAATKTVCETKNKDEAAALARILALVHAPENAAPMLEVQTRSKAAIVGASYLDQNVGCAAAGLIEIAAGRGALAESAEDGSFADEKGAKYTLPKDATVVIAHALDSSDSQKTSWGRAFGDYEILASFEQLGRPTFAIDAKEKTKDDLAPRFKGQEWGVSACIGKLARRGWTHGHPQDAGFVGDHSKAFFSANVTAVVEHTGYPIGARDYADAQKIEKIYFIAGTIVPPGSGNKKIKLEKVDKKALSEVLYDPS